MITETQPEDLHLPFDGASLNPIIEDIINDFGTDGSIEHWDTGDIDGISGEVLKQPLISSVVYVIDNNPALSAIGGKVENGDSIVTLKTGFIIKESYTFTDGDGSIWNIITATSVRLQGEYLLWELQVRK